LSPVPDHEVTPDERTLRARIAAHRQHAQGKTNTAPARAAFLDRFEREVDPDGTLPPDERARRAEHARKAYFLDLARKSAAARKRSA
jgi:hypothetical protein